MIIRRYPLCLALSACAALFLLSLLLSYPLALFAATDQSDNSPVTILLTTDPAVIRGEQPTTFIVDLKDASGAPLQDATVTLTLSKNNSDYKFIQNETLLSPSSIDPIILTRDSTPGRYKGTFNQFSENGAWDLNINVLKGNIKANRLFEIHVAASGDISPLTWELGIIFFGLLVTGAILFFISKTRFRVERHLQQVGD